MECSLNLIKDSDVDDLTCLGKEFHRRIAERQKEWEKADVLQKMGE